MNEIPKTMHAVHLLSHGGPDVLQYRTDVPVPEAGPGEVLIAVGAAGVNNTDINTRIGWYAKSVTGSTDAGETADDGGWSGSLTFPRIQGADAAGTIVAVGEGVDPDRIGDRVMVRSMQADRGGDPTVTEVFGSEFDGAFAQFCVSRSSEAFSVETDLTDIELASFPCAYSTAEGMLQKAGLSTGESVLITGASGGVGTAAIQLAKARGARVVGVAAESKWDALKPLVPDELVDRDTDLAEHFGPDAFDVVADVVAGPTWPSLLEVLRNQGRYVASGAIAGPIVELDVRTLYLKDLTLLGSTVQPVEVFENLIGYIESGAIVPMVARTYPLADIGEAQSDFLEKRYAGKLVLVP